MPKKNTERRAAKVGSYTLEERKRIEELLARGREIKTRRQMLELQQSDVHLTQLPN